MKENGLNKFFTIISEVSSFVGNPVPYVPLGQFFISNDHLMYRLTNISYRMTTLCTLYNKLFKKSESRNDQ